MSYKNLDVLKFYEHLPFNIHGPNLCWKSNKRKWSFRSLSRIEENIFTISINNYEKITSLDKIICNEKKLIYYAEDKIKNKEYFPGFFITIGRKI